MTHPRSASGAPPQRGAAGGPAEPDPRRPLEAAAQSAFTRFCAALSKAALVLAVCGLIALILCVQFQVVGRYIFNDTPTWAEALAMLLVLFVTAFGVAVGVRDAGHIGLESIIVLLPAKLREKIEVLVHALVAVFGALMLHSGWRWATLKWDEKKPMLGVPEGIDYVPLVIAGALIVLFSIEHIVALMRGERVEPAWN